MTNIILFTKQTSILKYWSDALENKYDYLHVEHEDKLIHSLNNVDTKNIVMLDENSIENIKSTLDNLKTSPHVDVLIFNNIPEVKHSISLIKNNVKGYENSFLHHTNLLRMIAKVEDGKKWLFAELNQHLINIFANSNTITQEPEFIKLLTAKEKKIALMIADGMTNKEILKKENIALSTVKGHIQKIFEKAKVTDRVGLVLKFK